MIYIAINKGYLTCDRTTSGDETFTPFYAVEPLIKYLPKDKIIWLPFDEEWSAFYQLLTERGHKVVRSSLKEGQDFFTYEPKEWDLIVSNPPFSKKDQVLKRLDVLGKPFAILLPLNSIQGTRRYDWCFKNGIQILAFDQRIGFHDIKHMDAPIEGSPFASAYFCRNVLPRDLIVEKLIKYERSLILNHQ